MGAVAGGYAGKAAGEAIDPTVEDTYWQSNYSTQPWVEKTYTYEDYKPAFRTGYEGYGKYATSGKTYAEVENDLARDYERGRGKSRLGWEKAKNATRAAWDRVERAMPGDADRDGK